MKLLLDTHTLLWFLNDDPQLSPSAKQLIEDPANGKWVSLIVCWEIVIKVGLRKLNLSEPASTFLQRELSLNHFGMLGLSLDHILHLEKLASHHKDPFDRLLAAQAITNGFTLVSKDSIFDTYAVTRAW